MLDRIRFFAHGAIAIQACVNHVLLSLRVASQEGEFAIQLRIENRIASRESHGRPAPFAVGGEIDARRNLFPAFPQAAGNHCHAWPKGRIGEPAVAGETLRGSDELGRNVRAGHLRGFAGASWNPRQQIFFFW